MKTAVALAATASIVAMVASWNYFGAAVLRTSGRRSHQNSMAVPRNDVAHARG